MKKIYYSTILLIMTIFISSFHIKKAEAQSLLLCNYSSYILEVAISLQKIDTFSSIGWYIFLPGRCKDIEPKNSVLEDLDSFYASFKEQDYYNDYSVEIHSNRFFCVHADNFVLEDASQCSDPDQYYASFREIFFNEDNKKFTAYISGDNKFTTEEANIAGLQRLASIANVSNVKIDGKKSAAFDKDINAFIKKNLPNFDSKDSYTTKNEKLYSSLVTAAREKQSKVGLFVCNNTDLQIWGVFGAQEKKKIVVKGWRQIATNSCLKVIKKPLGKNTIYYYAEAQKKPTLDVEKKPEMRWGGNVKLCISENSFIIDNHTNCEKKNLITRGFADIKVNQDFWIIHFGDPNAKKETVLDDK